MSLPDGTTQQVNGTWITVDAIPTMDQFKVDYPFTYNLTLDPIGIGFPKIAPKLGTGAVDAGVEIHFKCPGFPTCKRAAGACNFTKSQGIAIDPIKLAPIPISIPNIVVFAGFQTDIKVPPDIFNPLKCPNYNKK